MGQHPDNLQGSSQAGESLPQQDLPGSAEPMDLQTITAGLGQVYESPPLDLRPWQPEELAFDPLRPHDIPLAVRVEAEAEDDKEPCIHYSYMSFNKIQVSPAAQPRPPSWSVQVFTQKMQYCGQCYVLHDVFGASSKESLDTDIDGGTQDCIICLSEPRDTAVLPCRHMCFCSYCAGIVRLQCDRCPVCRQKVASLLQFKREASQPDAAVVSTGQAKAPVAATSPEAAMAASSEVSMVGGGVQCAVSPPSVG